MRMRATTHLTIVAVRKASPAAKRNYELDFADASIAVGENVVHYRHDGLPTHAVGVPIVLVHGLSGATTWWAKNPAVLGQRAEIYALNLPGFGRSRPGGSFDIRHETTVMASCMAAIGVGRAIVGGKIAGASSTRPATVSGARLRAIQPIGWLFWPTLLRSVLEAGPAVIARATQHLFTRPIADKLPAVRVPALLVCKDRGTLVPATIAEGVKARLGGPVTGPPERRARADVGRS